MFSHVHSQKGRAGIQYNAGKTRGVVIGDHDENESDDREIREDDTGLHFPEDLALRLPSFQ